MFTAEGTHWDKNFKGPFFSPFKYLLVNWCQRQGVEVIKPPRLWALREINSLGLF